MAAASEDKPLFTWLTKRRAIYLALGLLVPSGLQLFDDARVRDNRLDRLEWAVQREHPDVKIVTSGATQPDSLEGPRPPEPEDQTILERVLRFLARATG